MNRIIEVNENLVDLAGNFIGECVRKLYFKTELDTIVLIETDFYAMRFTPDEDDIFAQETLDAICRYLGQTNLIFIENDYSVVIKYFDENYEEIINKIIQQVDVKLDSILKEKGIDPNVKNDNFLNLYSDDDDDDLYEDIRNMYSYEELPYTEEEFTEPVSDIDDDDFLESLEVKDNTENKKTPKNWFGFIRK